MAYAPGEVAVHWAPGLVGVLHGMTKNLFAVFRFRSALLLAGAVGLAASGSPRGRCSSCPAAAVPAVLTLASLGGLYLLASRRSLHLAGMGRCGSYRCGPPDLLHAALDGCHAARRRSHLARHLLPARHPEVPTAPANRQALLTHDRNSVSRAPNTRPRMASSHSLGDPTRASGPASSSRSGASPNRQPTDLAPQFRAVSTSTSLVAHHHGLLAPTPASAIKASSPTGSGFLV